MNKYDKLLERTKPYRMRVSHNFLGKESSIIKLHSGVSIYLSQIEEDEEGMHYIDNGSKVYLSLRK